MIPSQAAPHVYPMNVRGETYGPEIYAENPDQAPDLILAVATNGREGYVRKVDLRGPQPRTLADVAAIDESAGRGRDIPVYESDGTTVIGTFHILPARSSR